MEYKPDLGDALKRYDAFWHRELHDRVLITVLAPLRRGGMSSMFLNPDRAMRDPARLLAYWTDPETMLANAISRIENSYMGGDILPTAFLNFGTSGHCAYLGARPDYQLDTIWFRPAWASLDQARGAIFNDELLQSQLRAAEFIARRAEGRLFVSMPDHCGDLDAMGHLHGEDALLIDMLDEPELVDAAAAKVFDAWLASNEAFYQALRPHSMQGSVHPWMHIWAPGRVQHMQVDLSVMISPAMYERFALPELQRQAAWIDYPIYHFDGDEQIRHLDFILSVPRIRAIQWTAVAGKPSAAHYLPVLRRMQAAGKSLIVMTPKEDIPALMDGLVHEGLYLHTNADDAAEAAEIVRYVAQKTRGASGHV